MTLKAVYLSVQSTDAAVMQEPTARLGRETGLAVELYTVNYEQAEDDILVFQELVRRTAAADFVYIRCMSEPERFTRWERYEKTLKNCPGLVFLYAGNMDVTLMHRDLFRGTDEQYVKLQSYTVSRGPANDYGLFYTAAVCCGKLPGPAPAAVAQRKEGVYHPGMSRDITLEEYRRTLKPDRPTVGILFTANYWTYDNLDAIDALIRGMEDHGMNTVPVFFSSVSFTVEGVSGTKAIVEQYFTECGKVLIDALVLCTSFSQLTNSRTCQGVGTRDDENYYKHLLNVPTLHAISINGDYHDFEEDRIGLGKRDITANVAYPEIDGNIITVPYAYTPRRSVKRAVPIPDRIDHLCRLTKGWASLRHKPAAERKIAVLLYQSRPDSGNIGGAAGLDGIESVASLLNLMIKHGYRVTDVPADGKALIREILAGVTNDLDNCSVSTMRQKAAALVPAKKYAADYAELPVYDRRMTEEQWGAPPGNICVDGQDIVIPGLLKGNVFIGYQPLRGWADKMEQNIHDPMLFAQHQYIAYYRWIKDVFKADVIMHIGTHGTLEWLPGKNVGLSRTCEPDMILDGVPNIYPYIIDDPGEGIQAKRRTESVVIGHMCPAMARADSYEELDEVLVPLQDYFRLRATASPDRRDVLVAQVYDAAKKHDLLKDLKLTKDPGAKDFEPYIVPLHEYLSEVKDALIRADLHVLGRVPQGKHMDEMLYSLTRLDNGGVPSLRDTFAVDRGVDLRKCLADPAGTGPDGKLNSVIIDCTDAALQAFLTEMRALDYDPEKCLLALAKENGKNPSAPLEESLRFACTKVAPNIRKMGEELTNIIEGLDGQYVLPGASGAPTRGNADILPMGRNFYGLDPDTVPNPSSWVIGRQMADQMIQKYVDEKGEYPREIGFIIWATDTMKTGGDDMSYILWLMGVRPVWNKTGGQVVGLEPVPLKELKRPRIDVTVHITGLFRDTFPNLIDMIDDAVKLVAGLDEKDEDNFLAANLRQDIVTGIAAGLTPDEARRRNSVRVFGAPPGGYGTGIDKMIEAGSWKTVQDLADCYIDWCSNGYSKGNYGMKMRDEFVKRFSKVGVTVKNMPDREIDLLDCDDVYQYLGGMNAFVRAYGRKDAMTVMGDGSDPKHVKVRDTAEECRYVFRSKILNPKFISGLKEHGYRGAGEMANITEYTMAWGATSDIVDDWMYKGLADKFLFDPATQKWLEDVNPYAMMNIINRLQEAIERGLWNADEETEQKLKDMYLKTEGKIEELTDR